MTGSVRRGLLLLGLAGAVLLHDQPSCAPSGDDRVAAVLPIQNRAGDQRTGIAVQRAIRSEFAQYAALVDPGRTRAAMRRLRVRDGDTQPVRILQELADELTSDWLIMPTLHDAEQRDVPRITVSVRVYSGVTGRLLWVGFHGGSGLDRETVFGLGVVDTLEALAPTIVERVLEDLGAYLSPAAGGQGRSGPTAVEELGTVAIVPLDGLTEKRRTANAETVTEAARAVLFRRGVRLVSPGCTSDVLRRRQAGLWGGVVPDTRAALRGQCGADLILTGTVEAYSTARARGLPDPRVAVALRVVDPVSGRILWMDALERSSRQLQGLFRAGRIYSTGGLADRLTDSLVRRLLKKWPLEPTGAKETG